MVFFGRRVTISAAFKQKAKPECNSRHRQSKRIENERVDLGNAILHDWSIDAPDNRHSKQVEVRPKSG